MKKAFTLIELLIVVVVLVTLMTIVFKLGTIGEDAEKKNTTVARLQRLENCLSGYYAAFGSYPPVKLHGSRNIYYKTNKYGIQQVEQDERDTKDLNWSRVNAACRSQPVGMNYPYASYYDKMIETVAMAWMDLHNSDPESAWGQNEMLANMTRNFNPGWISSDRRRTADWTHCQVFRFGLMSFLLPRFVVMMGNEKTDIYRDFAQWKNNNELPCRFEDGAPYDSWEDLNRDVMQNSDGSKNADAWKVEALPSQAVTARWMPNLETMLDCQNHGLTLYGVKVCDPYYWGNLHVENPYPMIYSGGDSQSGSDSGDSSTQYMLDGVTCSDGWHNEFYYYSLPPYQNYRLWSAGKNGRTFPPWISEEEISRDSTLNRNRNTIQNWIVDDIVHMSN